MKKSWLCLFGWIASFQVISFILGRLHKPSLDSWYVHLQRSDLTPPGYLFGIVWPILYTLLAIAGYLLWQNRLLVTLRLVFIVQMLINWSWTTVFFRWHWMMMSWMMIIAMIVLSSAISMQSYCRDRRISWLFVPYQVWLLFACYLNIYIWFYN